ncbi:MAG: TonB-dependent receptor [Bacteroidota bacterium]|nr:TonB-dependent receptor [Bacteroidota bacterium]
MKKTMKAGRCTHIPLPRQCKRTLVLALVLTLGFCSTNLLAAGLSSASAASMAPTDGEKTVTGKITDATGNPIPGATIVIKGQKTGTVTDMDGKFSLKAPSNAVLKVSFIGMKAQEVALQGRSSVSISLEDESVSLNEVVAIGYGVQKKKLVTGATVQVSGDNLQKLSTTNAFTALQSQTPGVNIVQNSGQPGDGFKVNIRGIGTIGNSAPLYVIDGVAGGDINSLNPSDIESIDVLKDAASSAIYGTRAANGVVLVTTKQGKSGKVQVTYDGYYGVQNVYKMPSLLNAQQYMAIENEVDFNEGISARNWKSILGSKYSSVMDGTWKGTNWMDAIRNKNAPTQNHAFNLVGGNDISKFSLGVAYTNQEGIFGDPVASGYERTSIRLNSDHVILKAANRDVIKLGENVNYNYSVKNGIGLGNQYWNDISNMLRAMPIMPIYNDKGGYFDNEDKTAMGLNTYDAQAANPIASMVYQRGNNKSKSHNLNASAYLQISPIKNLVLKSQFGYKMSASSYRSYTPAYNLSTTTVNTVSSVNQSANLGWSYTLDNTADYKFAINNHHVDVLAGQSLEKWGMGEGLSVTNGNLLFNGFEYAYLANTQGIAAGTTKIDSNTGPWGQGGLASVFGRINYDWNETYMLTLILRSDASSNFANGKRWGYFPSVSAGWVASNEKFMASTKSWLDFLKFRASWGQNGNCNISNFNYIALISFDQSAKYSFGNAKDSQSTGAVPYNLANPDVTWEKSEQLDFGFDARFLNSRLGVNFDYYDKTTKGWLVQAPIHPYFGVGVAPYVNGGDITNKGVEAVISWNDHVGKDFTYGINLNGAYNKNKVTRIANSEGIINGSSNVLAQGTTYIYRAQVGYPIGYFYGYKTAGVFQNQADIDAWKAAGNGILQSNVQPGDLKFVDLNHDGQVTDADRTKIGDPNPHFNMGLSFNLGYKGFDFTVAAHGAFGMQIAKNYRQTSRSDNYTTEVYQRWHGEGTSNKWPRLTSNSNANYMYLSDIYMENADYLKCQNITLGYDFKKLFPKMPLQQARLYFTAQNLFTITGYSGMDPEVGSSGGADSWASGIDIGYYPSPRTYLVGVNLKF